MAKTGKREKKGKKVTSDKGDTGDQIIERVVDSGAYDDTELRNLVKQLSEAKKQYKLLTKIAENTERQSHHAELLLK